MKSRRMRYKAIYIDSTTNNKYEHVIKIEKILGRPLGKYNQIHHRDGNGWNNSNANLIVCENQSYHRLIERRERAYRATGNASYRRCPKCGIWDDPKNLVSHTNPQSPTMYHIECIRAYKQKFWENNYKLERTITCH